MILVKSVSKLFPSAGIFLALMATVFGCSLSDEGDVNVLSRKFGNYGSKEVHFLIVASGYKLNKVLPDGETLCEKNVRSIASQTYRKFKVVFIDDASKDGTATCLREKVREGGLENQAIIVENQVNLGAMSNYVSAIRTHAKPDDVVVIVDGDDWLAHERVLEDYSLYYRNPNVWMTYGSFVADNGFVRSGGIEVGIPNYILRGRKVRDYEWRASHLRTFYAWLFERVKDEDLKYNGEFARTACDLGIMFPLLEMAGTHAYWNREVVYIYNRFGAAHDDKIDGALQLDVDRYFRSLPRYEGVELE